MNLVRALQIFFVSQNKKFVSKEALFYSLSIFLLPWGECTRRGLRKLRKPSWDSVALVKQDVVMPWTRVIVVGQGGEQGLGM